MSSSLYMSTTDVGPLWRMGCREGRVAGGADIKDVLIVLDFGRPARKWRHEGTNLIGGGFRTTWRIRDGVIGYATGFLRCTNDRPAIRLTLAAGTSNWGPHVTYGHGQAWAQMVNQANEWLRPVDRSRRVTVVGADDIELAWNGPRASKRWVLGYESVAAWPYLDYGDAGSCPPYGRCAGRWTLEDVWWVAWGSRSAWPLPEIYTNSGSQARQWYQLSVYSYARHGRPMSIAGVLSQRQACRQSITDSCWGTSNTPSRAWSQLWGLLNRDRRTAQSIRWATDIGYDR